MRYLLLSVVLVFGLGQAAKAESLAEKKKWKDQMEYLENEELKPMNTACGTEIKFDFDKDSFKNWPEGSSIYGYCGEVLGTLRTMCGEEDAKKEIASKVKKVVCKNEGKGKKLGLKLGGSTLHWGVAEDAANLGDFCKEWLMKNL
jgi:hypothetical protein